MIILQNGALNFKLTCKFSAINVNENRIGSGTFLILKIARTVLAASFYSFHVYRSIVFVDRARGSQAGYGDDVRFLDIR